LSFKSGNGNGASERVAVKQACTVLYDALPDLDPARLQSRIASLVGTCSIDWDLQAARAGMPLVGGMVQFSSHNVAMLALNAPVMKEVLDRTVGVSPMPEDKRAQLLGHKAAIRLLYLGNAPAQLDQLTALYHVAGALLSEGDWASSTSELRWPNRPSWSRAICPNLAATYLLSHFGSARWPLTPAMKQDKDI
jgi:hypothetical protein